MADSYFIRLNSPNATRRTILESTRDILKILQNYEAFKGIREERSKLIGHIKSDMNEIKSLFSQLKKTLPKTSIKSPKKVVSTEVVAKPDKELRKIEDELADIEKKLGNL